MAAPPQSCARCGAADSYRRRYTTGGGWRAVYVCDVCGTQVTGRESAKRVATGAVLAGAVAAVVAFLRRR